jgi:hypothetical protein
LLPFKKGRTYFVDLKLVSTKVRLKGRPPRDYRIGLAFHRLKKGSFAHVMRAGDGKRAPKNNHVPIK